MEKCVFNCDRWYSVNTEIKLFLQSSKFKITHLKLFHHILWLLYINPLYNTE